MRVGYHLEVSIAADPRAANEGRPILRVEGLRIGFGGRPAVDGISFEIGAGETLGLVGESGSGKSLTSLAVMGLLPAGAEVSGRVWFAGSKLLEAGSFDKLRTGCSPFDKLRAQDDNVDVRGEPDVGAGVDLLELPEGELRRLRGSDVAMIFQEPMTALNPVMRVGAQIAEAVRAHAERWPGGGRMTAKEVERRVVEAMREVAIPEPERRVRDYPHQFSGGQRQRILIAMAIVNRPRLLIADEPTTALDVTVQAQVLELLRELRRAHGLSMLFISHDLAVVAQVADRVAVMQHGRIVERAETAELFRNPQHPYTRRLLASAPTMTTERGLPLASL